MTRLRDGQRKESGLSMGQCIWLYLLISFVFLFASGFVCEPYDETAPHAPAVELPPPLPGSGRRRKRRKRNLRQYHLMKRVRRRPVWRPKRDPVRCWTDLTTWRWRRRVPTDAQYSNINPMNGYRPRHHSRTKRTSRKHSTDDNKTETESDVQWNGESSEEERFERLKVHFLHEPDVTYGMQYGVDVDAFVKQIDPLKQYRLLQQINATGILGHVKDVVDVISMRQKRALIAAAHLSQSLPRHMDAALSLDELTNQKISPSDLADLTRRRSVYFSTKDDLPIVIDTGGSYSVTPNVEDFDGEIRPADIGDLQGLSAPATVGGVGTVVWTIKDVFGSVRTIRTKAYYVPSAAIRLFSPQQYFQEHNAGEFWCNARRAVLTLGDGSELEFPYNPGSNLPLMLPDRQSTSVGFTFEDKASLSQLGETINMSVAHDMNQNLTAPQRELLTWHWKLGHANFQWIQRLAAQRRSAPDGIETPVLRTKNKSVSSCPAPLCVACQMAKQTRRNPEVKVGSAIPEKEMSLRRGVMQPGDMVSIDQYVSMLPGRLPHTKGKEPKHQQYNGGTLFVDHATKHIYLQHQVSLRVGDTLRSKTCI